MTIESTAIVERAESLRRQRVIRAGELLERITSAPAVSPVQRAASLRTQRLVYRDAFKAAEMSRLTLDRIAYTDRIDRELLKSLVRMRARARDAARNSNPIKHFNRLLKANVIGPKGFRIKGNKEVEQSWNAWAKRAISVDGRLTFNQLSRLALQTVATDGEVIIRLYRNFRNKWGFALQLIDPDMLDESFNRPKGGGLNEVRLGVEVNDFGAPVAYHLFEDPHGIWSTRGQRRRIPAEEILHVFDPERIGQTRGITWYSSALFPILMLDGYKEAETVAARTSAAKMGFFQQREGAVGDFPEGERDAEGKLIPPSIEAAPGTFEALPPGYEFQAWDPTHPSTAFPAFVKALMRDIASGLGVSYNALANDLESTSYGSMRFGMLIERDVYSALQEWWVASYLQPVFDAWIEMAMLKNAVQGAVSGIPAGYDDVAWIPRGWDWVDPLKDIQANSQAVTAGFTSRTRVIAEQGGEVETVFQEIAEEEALAKKLGIDITPKGAAFAPLDPAKDDEPSGSKDSDNDNGNGNSNGNGRSRLGSFAG